MVTDRRSRGVRSCRRRSDHEILLRYMRSDKPSSVATENNLLQYEKSDAPAGLLDAEGIAELVDAVRRSRVYGGPL